MIRFCILFLLCFGIGNTFANSFTFNILGHTFEDSSHINLETTYQSLLAKSTYLGDRQNPEKGFPKIRKTSNKTGVFLLSVLLLYAFAGIRLMFSHQFAGSLDILKNLRNHNKGQTEADSISLLSFYGLFLLTLGYASYNYLAGYQSILKGLPMLAGIILCCSAVTVLFILKVFLVWLIAWCFDKKQVFVQYFQKVTLIYKVAAIVLFPLSILFLLSSGSLSIWVLKLTLAILITTLLMRYVLNLAHIKKLLSVHFFHFFLYLCAFEIIPLMLLLKWLS
jgi:hypothetical protein